MSDVFISYSRKDQEMVSRIIDALQRRRVDIWIDQEDIGTGSRWDTQIQEGIANSEKVLVMLSKSSTASTNVGDEWSYALDKGKHIIPVLLEECDVPMRIASLQRVEFTQGYEQGLEKLIEEIRGDNLTRTGTTQKTLASLSINLPKPVKKAFWYAAPAVLLAILGSVFYVNYQVNVPSLKGLDSSVAKTVLKSHFLSLGNIIHEYSDNDADPAGRVFKTDPVQAKLFSPINIYVAKEKITMPDLYGMRKDQALELLKALNLEKPEIEIAAAEGKEQTIFNQQPNPGTRLKAGAPVKIYLVQEKIAVPDVLNLNLEAAKNQLDAVNLHFKVVHSVTHWDKPYGTIIKTIPTAGTKVTNNETVEIILAAKGGWIYLQKGHQGEIITITQWLQLA